MADFKFGEPVETKEALVEVTINPNAPLRPGRYTFQLVVVDDSGNQSLPDSVDIIIRDTTQPTAVITAPSAVEVGRSFNLSGEKSFDAPGGKIVNYVWTLLG